MIGTLRDLTKHTMIASLPGIINWNNKQIETEFDNLYNYEKDYLIKSVYVPNGTVTAHTGSFINLRVRSLTIEDPDSLGSQINLDKKHNDCKDRFSKDFDKFDPTKDCAHDIKMISGLEDTLKNLASSIRELWIRVSPKTTDMDSRIPEYPDNMLEWTSAKDEKSAEAKDVDGQDDEHEKAPDHNKQDNSSESNVRMAGSSRSIENIPDDLGILVNEKYLEAFNKEVESYQYPLELFAAPEDEMMQAIRSTSDIVDLLNKYQCNYIKADAKYVKVDNMLPVTIHAAMPGQVIYLIFDKVDKMNDFVICLHKDEMIKNYSTLRVPSKNIESKSIKLICTDINVEYGSSWRVLN